MNNPAKNNTHEDELDATRTKLYEQTKDMTTEERVAFFNDGAKEILARQGIHAKYARVVPVQRQAQP